MGVSQNPFIFAPSLEKGLGLDYGVMVAQQVLVLFDKVRVLMGQRIQKANMLIISVLVFLFLCFARRLRNGSFYEYLKNMDLYILT